MIVMLLGAPGAGKGTQARALSDRFQIPSVSTGQMLRDAAARGSESGRLAKQYTDQGLLVPDEIMIPIVRERIAEPDCRSGFVLDGFPRTVEQAEALDCMLAENRMRLDGVLQLVVDREELVRRLSGRRVCSRCGENYNLLSRPPKQPGICDIDGAPLIQRDDDKPEPIRKRLETCERDTAPVVEYYRRKGLLQTIDGSLPLDQVTQQIAEMFAASPNGAARGARIGETPAGQPASH
jgi:adenylate kinase